MHPFGLLCLALSLVLCVPVTRADDCRIERLAAVDLAVTSAGRVQIPVELNGIRVQMIIEAGSGLSSIWSGAAAPLNLEPKESIARGRLRAGSAPLTQTVKINTFKIGNVRWKPFQIVVYPSNQHFPQSVGEDDVVGFLGEDVFGGVDFEIDFAERQFRLYSQKHCAGKVVYWASNYDVLPLQTNALGNLFISMAVNGRLVSTSLSTMDSISNMEEKAAKEILGVDRSSLGDPGGSSDGCSYCRSITLKAQGLEIHNARVQIVDTVAKDCSLYVPILASGVMSYSCPGAFPLRLGVNVLSKLHLYFATGERKLYLTDAPTPASSARREPIGSGAANP